MAGARVLCVVPVRKRRTERTLNRGVATCHLPLSRDSITINGTKPLMGSLALVPHLARRSLPPASAHREQKHLIRNFYCF